MSSGAAPGARAETTLNLRPSGSTVCRVRVAGLTSTLQPSGNCEASQSPMRRACLWPFGVSWRAMSGVLSSASAWRHSIKSMRFSLSLPGSVIDARLRRAQQLHQVTLCRKFALLAAGAAAVVAAVRVQLPGVGVVFQVGVQSFRDDPAFQGLVQHGEGHLDAAEQVAAHPVGAGQMDVVGQVVPEIINAAVLEEA